MGDSDLYTITLEACDADTIVDIELTGEQVLLLRELARLVNKTSTYACMPKMYVELRGKKT